VDMLGIREKPPGYPENNRVFYLIIALYVMVAITTGIWGLWSTVEEQQQELKQKQEQNQQLKENLEQQHHEIKEMEEQIVELEKILDLRKTMYEEIVKNSNGHLFDITKPSGFTAEMLEASFEKYGGVALQGTGEDFVGVEDEHGINAVALAAICANETGWGTSRLAREKNNMFGWGAYDRDPYYYAVSFSSQSHSIEQVGYKIKSRYLISEGPFYNGSNLKGMNVRYATDPHWAYKAASAMEKMIQKAIPEDKAEKYFAYEKF